MADQPEGRRASKRPRVSRTIKVGQDRVLKANDYGDTVRSARSRRDLDTRARAPVN